MMEKLQVIAFFAIIAGGMYLLSLLAHPGKGWLHAAETICTGAILCRICGVIGQALGIQIAQSPLAALSAGLLGLPGVALCTVLSRWP